MLICIKEEYAECHCQAMIEHRCQSCVRYQLCCGRSPTVRVVMRCAKCGKHIPPENVFIVRRQLVVLKLSDECVLMFICHEAIPNSQFTNRWWLPGLPKCMVGIECSKVPEYVIVEWKDLDQLVDNRKGRTCVHCQRCVSLWPPPNHPYRLLACSTAPCQLRGCCCQVVNPSQQTARSSSLRRNWSLSWWQTLPWKGEADDSYQERGWQSVWRPSERLCWTACLSGSGMKAKNMKQSFI